MLAGLLKSGLQPGDVGRVALEELPNRGGVTNFEVVVAARHVQSGKHHALMLPPLVLHVPAVYGLLPGLVLDRYRALAQRAAFGEKALAQCGQSFEWIMRTVVGAVAIGPLVIARCVNQGSGKALEMGQLARELFVAASC